MENLVAEAKDLTDAYKHHHFLIFASTCKSYLLIRAENKSYSFSCRTIEELPRLGGLTSISNSPTLSNITSISIGKSQVEFGFITYPKEPADDVTCSCDSDVTINLGPFTIVINE